MPEDTLRYVILTHDHPELHWDLMLESSNVLRTWRLSARPGTSDVVKAVPLSDHRLEYLSYEGPVSGDRGSVTRWDEGTYSVLLDSDRQIVVNVCGKRLKGTLQLSAGDDRMTLSYVPATVGKTNSV